MIFTRLRVAAGECGDGRIDRPRPSVAPVDCEAEQRAQSVNHGSGRLIAGSQSQDAVKALPLAQRQACEVTVVGKHESLPPNTLSENRIVGSRRSTDLDDGHDVDTLRAQEFDDLGRDIDVNEKGWQHASPGYVTSTTMSSRRACCA